MNVGLVFLDLFDVNFGDEAGILLGNALQTNKTLLSLRLSNTSLNFKGATTLLTYLYLLMFVVQLLIQIA